MKRKGLKVDAVFDIETFEWDTFVVGGFYDGSVYEDFWHDQEDGLVSRIVEPKHDIYSHFGGRFDMLWVLDRSTRANESATAIGAGNRLISARADQATLRDSWAIAPMSLEKFTTGGVVKKQRLELPCRCGEDCGGYCSIRRSMPANEREDLRDYLRADCISLFEALESWETFCAENDIDLCATVGASAWCNVQRTADIAPSDLHLGEYNYLRAAYFGGRVEVYQPEAPYGWEHDVHSMYPAMLAHLPMPCGERTKLEGDSARAAFATAKPGVYSASVYVPDMEFPPLPFRSGIRVWFPTGRFSGRWALPELQRALDVGCRVDVTDAMVWDSERVILHDWCERIFALESANPRWKENIKFLRNSLTGKFGTSIDRRRFVINPDRVTPGMEDLNGRVYAVETQELSACGHLEWSLYLTSRARVKQHIQLCHADSDALYGDTDSVMSKRELFLNVGDGLGEYSRGKKLLDWDCIAPKVYSYTDAKSGELKARAKGVKLKKDPRTDAFLEKPRVEGSYNNSGVHSLMPAANISHGEKLFLRRAGKRHLTRQTGGRILMPDGRTRPPNAIEIESLSKRSRIAA